MEHNGNDEARADFRTSMTGFGLALVWILIVGGFSYWLAAGH